MEEQFEKIIANVETYCTHEKGVELLKIDLEPIKMRIEYLEQREEELLSHIEHIKATLV